MIFKRKTNVLPLVPPVLEDPENKYKKKSILSIKNIDYKQKKKTQKIDEYVNARKYVT